MISPCHGLGRFVYELRFLDLPDQHVLYFRGGPSNELSIRLRQSQMKRPILQYISKMSELILLENTLPHPQLSGNVIVRSGIPIRRVSPP